MDKKKAFLIYVDIIELVSEISDQQLGELFRAVLEFVNSGVKRDFKELALRILYKQLTMQIDRDKNRYDNKCKQMQANANKRKQKQTTDNNGGQIGSDIDIDIDIDTDIDINREKKIQGVCEDLQKFFGYESEIKYLHKQKEIDTFVRRLYVEGKLEEFNKQFKFYRSYKKQNNERTHSFKSFMDGGWESDNWEKRHKETSKTQDGWS